MKKAIVILTLLASPIFAQERPRANQTPQKAVVAVKPHCGIGCWSKRILLAPGIVLRLVLNKRGEINFKAN